MTSSDFHDWKRHPVTQEVFSQLQARIAVYKDQLVAEVCDSDPRRLSMISGIVQGFEFLLNIDFEDANGN